MKINITNIAAALGLEIISDSHTLCRHDFDSYVVKQVRVKCDVSDLYLVLIDWKNDLPDVVLKTRGLTIENYYVIESVWHHPRPVMKWDDVECTSQLDRLDMSNVNAMVLSGLFL